MKLTNKQELAIKRILEAYQNGDKYVIISGYAGAGKSTTVKYAIEALVNKFNIQPFEVTYACFTGKAAQVLIDKGNDSAKTLHKLIYQTVPTKEGTFIHTPKLSLNYKVVVVDEISMVPKTLWDTLIGYDTFIIGLGDPGQLPPINPKESTLYLLEKPDVFLDEIMRQAQDSGIIQLSMRIREGKPIDGFKTDDAIVLPKKELCDGQLLWSDINICAKNATRIELNHHIRNLKGYTAIVENGEKLINLKNDWKTLSEDGAALTNGCIGYFTDYYEKKIYVTSKYGVVDNQLKNLSGIFTSENGESFGRIYIDRRILEDGTESVDNKTWYALNKTKFKKSLPHTFDYAYAITAWKAQGSQWNNVLVYEEDFPFDVVEHKKFLYTAVTRAAEKVVLLR